MEKTVTGAKKIVCTREFVIRSHDQREVAHVRHKHMQELTLNPANGVMVDD